MLRAMRMLSDPWVLVTAGLLIYGVWLVRALW